MLNTGVLPRAVPPPSAQELLGGGGHDITIHLNIGSSAVDRPAVAAGEPILQSLIDSVGMEEPRYQPFWELVMRTLRDAVLSFKEEELPPPLARYRRG